MSAPDDDTLRAYAPAGLCMMGVEESGEDSTCGQPATHKITGPHDYDPGHWYCEAHGREVHAAIEYRHRWRIEPLPGVAEAVTLAAEVLRLRRRDLENRAALKRIAAAVRRTDLNGDDPPDAWGCELGVTIEGLRERAEAAQEAVREWAEADDAVTAAEPLDKLDALERRVTAGLRLHALSRGAP